MLRCGKFLLSACKGVRPAPNNFDCAHVNLHGVARNVALRWVSIRFFFLRFSQNICKCGHSDVQYRSGRDLGVHSYCAYIEGRLCPDACHRPRRKLRILLERHFGHIWCGYCEAGPAGFCSVSAPRCPRQVAMDTRYERRLVGIPRGYAHSPSSWLVVPGPFSRTFHHLLFLLPKSRRVVGCVDQSVACSNATKTSDHKLDSKHECHAPRFQQHRK